MAASESLYELDPDSESAHKLAMIAIGQEDLESATFYLQMALSDDKLSGETRADWFYKLSIISLAKGEHCEAIEFAREAIAYLDNHGKAYIALGDACIASREQLGDDFQQRTAYWVAADMYAAAAKMDPALAEESSQKLASCSAQFPNKEDIFFQDFRLGNNFRVGGCIQQNTTIRSRD
jgi:tetratricopeptide (TPR) repeat protein